jgi:signal transduction histidine kinase
MDPTGPAGKGGGRAQIYLKAAWRVRLAVPVVTFAAYFIAGILGLRLAFLNPSATPVWAPAGIAMAALILYGRGVWPAVAAAAFLVNLLTSGSAWTSLVIAGGNTLEGLAGAYLVHRYANGAAAFLRASHVFRFILLAVTGAAVIAATVGVTTLSIAGLVPPAEYGSVWLTWWLGDAAGILLVTPPLVLWVARFPPGPGNRRRGLEFLAVLLAVLTVGELVFSDLVVPESGRPLGFMCIPVLLWAAFRLGPREASTLMLVLAFIATWGTVAGVGPFGRYGPHEALLLLQAFLAASAMMTLALAAVVRERWEAHQRLEERVNERTKELRDTQDALLRRERVAVLGQLAGGVGHELRNPLGVMNNAVFYLAAVLRDAPDDVQEYLGILRRQIDLSDKIIGKLFDFARGELPDRQPVALPELVRAQLQRMEPGGVTTRVDLPGDLPDAQVDPVQIGQVILNLLTNALQAMGERGTLTIEGGVNGQFVELRVTDSGPGVLPENTEKIFEPLFTTKARGMGLGLAVSRLLARANGGELTARSAEGGGACFVLSLPTATAG